tara:strand:- start:464 stop:640 length:177 start_codon:yes stop_codon:yes gene_type:complete
MTAEKIQEAYRISRSYVHTFYKERGQHNIEKDVVQIGIQMAINGEVSYNEDGTVKRID